MLSASYRQHVQRSARWAVVQVLVGACIAAGPTLGSLQGRVHPVFAGLGVAVAWLVVVTALGPFHELRTPYPLTPIFDRRVVGEVVSGRGLIRVGAELDAIALAHDVAPPSSFTVFGLAAEMARFRAADGLATIRVLEAAVRANPGMVPDADAILDDLVRLRDRLVAAEALDARFCLMPIGAWSSAAETNLGPSL